LRVLAKRAEARGQTNLSGLVRNENGELIAPPQIRNTRTEIDLGPQVNRPYKNEKHSVNHLIQEDYTVDVVQETTKGNPKKFWDFLDSSSGRNFWTSLYDSTHRNSLTNPHVADHLARRYSK
jgi:hypothetical protein